VPDDSLAPSLVRGGEAATGLVAPGAVLGAPPVPSPPPPLPLVLQPVIASAPVKTKHAAYRINARVDPVTGRPLLPR
jgi:hypothetical protein